MTKWFHGIHLSSLGLELGKNPCLSCESSDAMHVYETNAHCFSCGTSFDPPAILMAQQGCSFTEALIQLKGARAWVRNPDELDSMFDDTQDDKLPDSATDFDPKTMPPDDAWALIGEKLRNARLDDTCRDWLSDRGLDPDFCHEELDVRSMHPHHWSGVKTLIGEAQARRAGIIATSKKNHKKYTLPWYDYPWLLLPYTRSDWRWSTVRHRAVHKSDTPKILSPAGKQPAPLPFLALKAQDVDGPLWVVEGETDAMSLWAVGCAAVASPGASVWRDEWRVWLTEQADKRRVLVVGDGDEAGKRFVRNVSRGMDHSVTKAVWSDGMDANDLLLNDKLRFEICEIFE